MNTTVTTTDRRPCACTECSDLLNRNAKETTTICSWCKSIHSVGRQALRNRKASDAEAHRAYYNQ